MATQHIHCKKCSGKIFTSSKLSNIISLNKKGNISQANPKTNNNANSKDKLTLTPPVLDIVGCNSNPFRPLSKEEIIVARNKALENIGAVDAMHDLFDPIFLVQPRKKEVLDQLNTNGKQPDRLVNVPFWRGGQEDVYTVYTIKLTCSGDNIVGELVGERVIKNGRPKYSCVDDSIVNDLLFSNDELIDILIHRMNGGQNFVHITKDNVRDYLYFDVAIDGRLDDCCECIDCQGEAAIIKETKPRPHTFIASPFFNNALYYCNDGANCNPEDCPPCECFTCGDDSSCPTGPKGQLYPGSVSAYIQPIEGVFAIVDRRFNRILKIVNEGPIIPIQTNSLDWRKPLPRNTLKPIYVSMPDVSWSYDDITGFITWEKHKFRIGIDANIGPVVYNLSYDGISIAYYISLQEHITAYGSSEQLPRMRAFFDIAEYPPRDFQTPLVLGVDGIPPYATVINADFSIADPSATDDESYFTVENAVAIYEYESPDSGWSHFDYPCDYNSRFQGRANRRLAITWRSQVSNYAYINKIEFDQLVRHYLSTCATGVMEHTGTLLRRTPHEDCIGGTLTRPYTIASNHAHLKVWAIDYDIHTPNNNTVIEENFKLLPISQKNPCGNEWCIEHKELKTEKDAIRTQNGKKGRTWVVENSSITNQVGLHPGIEVHATPSPFPVVPSCSRLAKRATYTQGQFFVTAYKDDEFYDVGTYPIERGYDTGLGKYIKDNDRINNRDVVVHVVVTEAHSPTTEEYPVMPIKKLEVVGIPKNMFYENPALDVDPCKWLLCKNPTQ